MMQSDGGVADSQMNVVLRRSRAARVLYRMLRVLSEEEVDAELRWYRVLPYGDYVTKFDRLLRHGVKALELNLAVPWDPKVDEVFPCAPRGFSQKWVQAARKIAAECEEKLCRSRTSRREEQRRSDPKIAGSDRCGVLLGVDQHQARNWLNDVRHLVDKRVDVEVKTDVLCNFEKAEACAGTHSGDTAIREFIQVSSKKTEVDKLEKENRVKIEIIKEALRELFGRKIHYVRDFDAISQNESESPVVDATGGLSRVQGGTEAMPCTAEPKYGGTSEEVVSFNRESRLLESVNSEKPLPLYDLGVALSLDDGVNVMKKVQFASVEAIIAQSWVKYKIKSDWSKDGDSKFPFDPGK